jgi:predicted enzyme related to lactoylglutathione lyase
MPRVIHFEIPSDQPERASKFYNDVFDWNIQKWEGGGEPYWLVQTGEKGTMGIDGGMMKRPHPGASTVNVIDVPSLDEYMQKVTDNGGTVVVPKMEVPTVGWLAYCNDTEGNTFGMMEMFPTAG